MERSFRHNHYVPVWYQKKFLPKGCTQFSYLDLRPDRVRFGETTYDRHALLNWGPKRCFAEDDLYTTQWPHSKNTEIEQFFFGLIDREGKAAIEYFADFSLQNGLHDAFEGLVRYMSVQKLRTPKGLAAFASFSRITDKNRLLLALQQYANLYCATWTDAVWQIVDTGKSNIGFLLSDHPVTLYNRAAFPGSRQCAGPSDPDIRAVATQTIFPLSSDKALFLTNLAWVRDPYQKPLKIHPNPDLLRTTMFKATDIQVGRSLDDDEVLQVNHVIKSRAYRYIAAADREWLYPEKYLASNHWSKLGDGFLFMPEPRCISMGGTVYVGYDSGRSESWSEYGHRPWQEEYENKRRSDREAITLRRFQSEFAARFGPQWRGWAWDYGRNGPPCDDVTRFQKRISGAAKGTRRSGSSSD